MKDKQKDAANWADGLKVNYITDDKSEYPNPKEDRETYGSYKKRVDLLVEKNKFDLGRLSWNDWTDYCRGNFAPDEYEYNNTVAYFEAGSESNPDEDY